MKDYKRFVLWLDYFNSALSRDQGRRIPLNKSVKDPKLEELSEAVRRLGFSPEGVSAKHPQRMGIQTGYVSIEKPKEKKKSLMISEVAKALSQVRGEKTSVAAASSTQKGPHKK